MVLANSRRSRLSKPLGLKHIIDFPFDIVDKCNYNVFTYEGSETMRARVIKIGNSHGLRIPKPILEQTGIRDDVEIELEKNKIIIRPVQKAREGWDKAFKMMAKKGDDKLIISDKDISHSWDEEEWQW